MFGVSDPPARLVSTVLAGPAGALEALLRLPATPCGAAVVAHPHPLHGGTMHTKVVHRTARVLSDRFGLAALRFNFRGVGASQGTHDAGRGEVDDLVAAARFVRGDYPMGPFVMAGFSFGSLCALRAAPLVRPDLLVLIGLPLDRFEPSLGALAGGIPVVWMQGERDEFGGAVQARGLAADLGFSLHVVEGADHFFAGRLDAFEETLSRELEARLPGQAAGTAEAVEQ
ncbi:MAG: alpha/beta fold hydrolase [Thermoanaerobaculia bacterium]